MKSLLVFVLLLAAFSSQQAAEATTARPNILFILGDNWRWPTAGILGDPIQTTPRPRGRMDAADARPAR